MAKSIKPLADGWLANEKESETLPTIKTRPFSPELNRNDMDADEII
jgi:hypothetical protein